MDLVAQGEKPWRAARLRLLRGRASPTSIDADDAPRRPAQHEHAVRQVHRLVDVVRDVDDRDAPFSACAWRRSTRSWSSARVSASTDANGSSRKTTSGRETRARAIATRCCIPPESCHGYLLPDALQTHLAQRRPRREPASRSRRVRRGRAGTSRCRRRSARETASGCSPGRRARPSAAATMTRRPSR